MVCFKIVKSQKLVCFLVAIYKQKPGEGQDAVGPAHPKRYVLLEGELLLGHLLVGRLEYLKRDIVFLEVCGPRFEGQVFAAHDDLSQGMR